MTMHMLGPAFNTTGKSKSKSKFKSAEAAKRARENAESWKKLLEKWDIKPQTKNKRLVSKATKLDPVVSSSFVYNPKRDTSSIASVDSGVGVAPKKEVQKYTGDEMIGIGQLHKSNSVPVFRKQDAEDQAKMRRN